MEPDLFYVILPSLTVSVQHEAQYGCLLREESVKYVPVFPEYESIMYRVAHVFGS